MLHHVEIYVSNLGASRNFWAGILARIDWRPSGDWKDGFTLASGDDAYLTFVQVAPDRQARPYHRCGVGLNHLAFKVKTRVDVDALRTYCVENGIPMLYDDRYLFAGGDAYYALYFEDPDRIKVEFVASD